MNQLSDIAPAAAALSDRELVMQFESLGDNCEFGLVQRRAGAEPLGLFRFSGTPLRHLLRGMAARFEGMADPDRVSIRAENGEYLVKLTKYDYIYHADVKVGEEDLEVLHRHHVRNVRFLVDEFIADLENPEKIFVFRQNEPLSAIDLVDLRAALARFGRSTLLWVTQACAGHPPGSVDVIDRYLMVGYVKRLAERHNVPNLDVESWMTVIRRAWALWPERHAAASSEPIVAVPPSSPRGRVDVAFGADGNAEPSMGFGWSKPENGFTWSIEDRSLLTIDAPPEASDYWLEMDVIPYMAPPSVPLQILSVSVNGTPVHRFEPLTRGTVGCAVPGALVHGRDTVEILFEHPLAASPRDVAGENDERRLAIAFRTLSLVCA